MTRADLEVRIAAYFENSIYYTQTDLVNAIQDGYDESVAYSGCIFKTATIPFIKNLSYYDALTAIPDLVAIVAIFNRANKRWLIPISRIKFDSNRDDWETTYGTPEFFNVISHRYFCIYRKPSIDNFGDMVVFYRASAPVLGSADSFLIDTEHLDALESYCRVDLLAQQQEWVKATTEFQNYIKLIEDLKSSVDKKNSDRVLGLNG